VSNSELQPIWDHIDANFDGYVQQIQAYLRIPGISTTGEGIRESADYSRGLLEDIGASHTELVETEGNPVVYGRLDSGRDVRKTLIASSLYDLVPVKPHEWLTPPFEAQVVDSATAQTVGIPAEAGDVIIARGAANQRGPSLAFMLAVKSIREVTGSLPVNLLFSLDGEEEIASPNWKTFLREKEDELRTADAAFQHGFRTNESGRHLLHCGFKGLTLFELIVRGGTWGGTQDGRDLWAADILWVHSPIQKLIEAMRLVLDENGRCLVPGFYDGIRPNTPGEQALYDRLRAEVDIDGQARARNVAHFRDYKDPRDIFIDIISGPVLNVDGLVSGYTEGFTTVMPMKAVAKYDVRLVPDQSADDFFTNLRAHLDAHGFDMVEINRMGGTEPGRTPVDHPLISAADKTGQAFGFTSEVWPISAAANPLGMYARDPFDLPILFAGTGRSGNYHVPNEWCSVEDIRTSMKWVVSFLYELGAQDW
jgi:acetylornithine deacetylase/succinyl-diaminopimelate desuccinylase-like protein